MSSAKMLGCRWKWSATQALQCWTASCCVAHRKWSMWTGKTVWRPRLREEKRFQICSLCVGKNVNKRWSKSWNPDPCFLMGFMLWISPFKVQYLNLLSWQGIDKTEDFKIETLLTSDVEATPQWIQMGHLSEVTQQTHEFHVDKWSAQILTTKFLFFLKHFCAALQAVTILDRRWLPGLATACQRMSFVFRFLVLKLPWMFVWLQPLWPFLLGGRFKAKQPWFLSDLFVWELEILGMVFWWPDLPGGHCAWIHKCKSSHGWRRRRRRLAKTVEDLIRH